MKNPTRLVLLLSAFTFVSLTAAKATTYPDLTYTVNLNLANLAGYMANAPISLDLQLDQGSNNISNTVTLSNFVFTGGTASSPSTIGGASGSTATSVVLTDSTSFNDFSTALSSGVTAISFKVDQTPNAEVVGGGTAIPDQFNVDLFDANGNNIPTTDPTRENNLVSSDLGPEATVKTYSIVAAPEPGPTSMLFAGGLLFAGMTLWRRRQA